MSAIVDVLSNPIVANIAGNSASRVAVETTLKAIGRPGFIIIDKDIDRQTKRYAATKEFLYQATCLAVYLLVIPPIFKNGAFKLAKKFCKHNPEFAKFKNANEYLDYRKYAEKIKQNRIASLQKDHHSKSFMHDGLRDDLFNKEKPELYPVIKGAIELGTLIGSILGLAVLAPEVGHKTIHPILRMLGMEEKPDKKTKLNTQA